MCQLKNVDMKYWGIIQSKKAIARILNMFALGEENIHRHIVINKQHLPELAHHREFLGIAQVENISV